MWGDLAKCGGAKLTNIVSAVLDDVVEEETMRAYAMPTMTSATMAMATTTPMTPMAAEPLALHQHTALIELHDDVAGGDNTNTDTHAVTVVTATATPDGWTSFSHEESERSTETSTATHASGAPTLTPKTNPFVDDAAAVTTTETEYPPALTEADLVRFMTTLPA